MEDIAHKLLFFDLKEFLWFLKIVGIMLTIVYIYRYYKWKKN